MDGWRSESFLSATDTLPGMWDWSASWAGYSCATVFNVFLVNSFVYFYYLLMVETVALDVICTCYSGSLAENKIK